MNRLAPHISRIVYDLSAIALCSAIGFALAGCAKHNPQHVYSKGKAMSSNSAPAAHAPGPAASQPAASAPAGSLQDSVDEAGVTKITLDISNASISCGAEDLAPGTVQVDWRITPATGMGPIAKVEELDVKVINSGGQLTIKDEYTGDKHARWPELKVWIKLQRDIPLACQLGNGNLELDLPHIAELDLGNGRVAAKGALDPAANISIGNGTLEGSLLISGDSHVISVGNGRISLELAQGSSCAVTAATGVGQINTKGFTSQRSSHLTGSTLSGTVGSGTGKLELSAGNGQIEVEAL